MVLFPPAFSISTFLNVKWYHGFGLGFDDVGPVLSLWLVCHVWVGRVLLLLIVIMGIVLIPGGARWI